MREPQARSILGTCRRAFGAAILLTSVVSVQARAQIHGSGPSATASPGWWLSAGVNGAVLGDIADGRNNQRWKFGNDPLWQMRGTLERVHDEFTSYGVSVAYGKVNFTVQPLIPPDGAIPIGGDTATIACRSTSCAATANLWNVMGQFRSGGGKKFHTLLEASAGAMGVLGIATKTSKVALDSTSGSWDALATLGGGFALPLGSGFQLALVQDFGIGWHSKAELPEGTGRTWRSRSTRAYVRVAFGAHR